MSETNSRSSVSPSPPPSSGALQLRSAFDDLVGLEFDVVERGRVTAYLDVDARHHQPFGLVHGGVYATVIEAVASVGAHVLVSGHGQTAVGVHNATDFLRPHAEGRLVIVGEPVHVGRTQQLWQVDVTRATDGKTVARGHVRLSVVSRPASAGVAPRAPAAGGDDGFVQ